MYCVVWLLLFHRIKHKKRICIHTEELVIICNYGTDKLVDLISHSSHDWCYQKTLVRNTFDFVTFSNKLFCSFTFQQNSVKFNFNRYLWTGETFLESGSISPNQPGLNYSYNMQMPRCTFRNSINRIWFSLFLYCDSILFTIWYLKNLNSSNNFRNISKIYCKRSCHIFLKIYEFTEIIW